MAPMPDRWQKIERLYHAALDRDPADRASFLNDACGPDDELRGEVESLLAADPTGQRLFARSVAPLVAEAATAILNPGTRLGPYQIEALIGEGGMGKVYRALDTRLGRTVAVKISGARFSHRFEREARAVAALNHQHICHLYDVGPDYLVMEYVEGTPLKGPLPVDRVLKYAEQICDALDAAHQGGITHRDLKPGNILLSKQGIKLLDFGLAQREASPDDPTMTQITQAGALMGTPAYMAPEQWEGKKADARSDIYSFGCVLYEMITGKRAAGRSGAARMSAEVSPELERILAKCLEVDPDLRYQHASDIRSDLQHLKQNSEQAHSASGAAPSDIRGPAKRWKALVAAAAVLALSVAGYFYLRRSPELTDKDMIVLADFANRTGDTVFDGTLRQGLAVQLEQSPFLSLVSDERIHAALGMMNRAADTALNAEVAKEICERVGAAAVLEGSIVSLGSQYVLSLRAKSCRTGEILDDRQAPAAKKEDVLNALSGMAAKFRERAGESLSTVRQHSTPLAEATTPSLEALKAYSAGWNAIRANGSAAAVPFFKRAVAIDPGFATAYAFLGRVYGDIGETVLSAESTTKAYQLRERAGDAERFFITATYFQQVTGNLLKARETLELWVQTYPREIRAPSLLSGQVYPALGQWQKAVEAGQESVALDPDFPFSYPALATAWISVNRLTEAGNVLQQAAARGVAVPHLLAVAFQIAFLKGDRAAMERTAAQGRGKPEAEEMLLRAQAFALAYAGRLQQARSMYRPAADAARQEQPERAALLEAGAAVREALAGNAIEAKKSAASALRLSRAKDVRYGAAVALALAADSSGSRTLANQMEKDFPEDTSVIYSYLPVLRALLSLNRSDPKEAVEALQVAAPYEIGWPSSVSTGSFGALYPAWVRGEAYLAAHRGAEAVVEFRKILSNPGIVYSDPVGALARLQIGRAYLLANDAANAKRAYRDFLDLWKDADPDIPLLDEAKAEYAKLQ